MGLSAPKWERRYGRKLQATDALIVFGSVFGAQFVRFGLSAQELQIPFIARTELVIQHSLLSLLIALVWLLALAIGDSRDPTIYGVGPAEYKRVISLTLLTFGLFAILAYLTRTEIARGYMLIALPAGLLLLLLSRWLWRVRLHRQRGRGLNTYRTLIVGERQKSEHVAGQLARDPNAGFELLGAVTERGSSDELLPGVPVVASYEELLPTVDRLGIDTLIMTSQDSIDPQRIRRIGWALEERNVDLIVAAALTDVAGPRIHARPVAGLPLIHVEHPRFRGRKYWMKRTFDVLGSGFLIVLLSPLFLVIAAMVKLTSPGPLLFKHTRIGQNGEPFQMLKFRSMVNNADSQLKALLAEQGTDDTPLFKVVDDPRITPFGAFIRRYSLDELPQLFNAFLGSMSLVGPRPQVAEEVALYDHAAYRRLMVKPGLTGLWQVSGRSNLSWEDTIRIDLYYIENWSMTGDLLILLRTVRTVLSPEGAY